MRRSTALLVGCAIAAALILGGLVGGVRAESPFAEPSPAVRGAPALADRALATAAGGVSAQTIAGLEEEVRSNPADADLLVQLGFAYQLRWRESADASYLPRSRVALRRALSARPDDANATLGLGSLALIEHEFRQALVFGRRARSALPGSARPFGIIGDALLELGRYDEAFAAFERMVALRPNLASYARIAYARELTGDRRGAIAAMGLALDAAGGQIEATAWCHVELAKLELGSGHVSAAGRHVAAALHVLPGYPAARVLDARVGAAQGRLGVAVVSARRAAEAVPTTEAVALLADLLERSGNEREARRARGAVALVERLLRANGVRVDLESAAYRADQALRPAETVALARRARAARPSIYGDDVLGWALARAGRCREALPWLERAARLGTRDALLLFHRGFAYGCSGDHDTMADLYRRALALSPEFSIRWAPVAREALSRKPA